MFSNSNRFFLGGDSLHIGPRTIQSGHYMCNSLFAMTIQFQEIIALKSHIPISVCKLNKGLLFYG